MNRPIGQRPPPPAGEAAARRPVTVIALCYNHARFVVECLESIRAQTFQDFQLIVTDDGSSDGSADRIDDWLRQHRPDAVFLRHGKNVGLCRTLNEAIARSEGDYISMIATDDVWEASKIEQQLAVMRNESEQVAVVYSDAIQIDEAGARLPKDFIEQHRPGFEPPSGHVFAALAHDNFIPAMATLIRRQAIVDAGGYDERLLFEDYDMWLRLAQRHRFVFHPAKVARYRIVSTSIVRTSFSQNTAAFAYSMFMVCERKLGTKLLSDAERRRQTQLQWAHVYQMYLLAHPKVSACLWISARRTGRLRIALLACLSSIGISRSRAQRIRSLCLR